VGVLAVNHVPQSAAVARRAVGDDLTRHGIGKPAVDDVVLVVSELVGNAVLHASATDDQQLRVSWELEADAVVVGVLDGTAELPLSQPATPDAPSGRGLAIVAALARDWGVRCDEQGKQVWARVPVRHLVTA
jgi:anti-sigma regulatory factor (Ser/Thr protein kinase)